MALLSDIIYHLEITEDIYQLDLSQIDCIKTTKYLISNLQTNHQIPGNVYYQFLGILDWHREYGFITPKQHYWLIIHLWQYIDQRNMIGEMI
jgi:hypothetical protein